MDDRYLGGKDTARTFKGAARPLEAKSITRLAQKYGVSEADVRAVMEVEASGSGFDKNGRPKMLFEPHVFWRELSPEARKEAEAQGLAYQKWGTRPYPKDSYPILQRAMKIDQEAAMRASSWGLGQVMGFNHKAAGYSNVKDMVDRLSNSEEAQLDAMLQFIANQGYADALRAHDWEGFAKGYNGPGYAKHNYHTRLAAAHKKFSK